MDENKKNSLKILRKQRRMPFEYTEIVSVTTQYRQCAATPEPVGGGLLGYVILVILQSILISSCSCGCSRPSLASLHRTSLPRHRSLQSLPSLHTVCTVEDYLWDLTGQLLL